MNSRDFARRYARSPWGIGSAFLALGAGLLAAALGASPVAGMGAGVAVLGACLGLSLATGLGQKAAVVEAERDSLARASDRMRLVAEARARLEALRLPAGEVARARDLAALEAGRLGETFARSGAYDPEAAQAVLDCLEIVDAWMRERDQAATERRFDLPDADPFPEAERRSAAAIREKAAIVARRRAAAAGDIPPADLVAIEEELK